MSKYGLKPITLTIVRPVGDVLVYGRRPKATLGNINIYADIVSALAVRPKDIVSFIRIAYIEI